MKLNIKAIDSVEHANIIQIEPGYRRRNNKDEGKEKGVKTESKDEGERPRVEDTPTPERG